MTDHSPEREAVAYPHIVRAVFGTPWAIMEETFEAIVEIVQLRVDGEKFTAEEIEARTGRRPSQKSVQTVGNVAVIPIYGVISPRATLFSQISGGTSITGLQSAFREALTSPDVNAIVFDIDSPGGSTEMIADFAGEIRAARGKKPMVAVANTLAASAAYWLGSQADELIVSPSGHVGSIGVIAAHDDVSAARDKLGVKTTLVTAGKYKGEASPLQPLSEEGKAMIQERVDDMYGLFVADVAAGRGVAVDAVKGGFGEGTVVSAQKAVTEGMADRVGTFDMALQRAALAGATVSDSATRAAAPAATAEPELSAGPIAYSKTATSDKPWDGPANKARLRNDGNEAYYRSAFAWQDSSANPNQKGSYKFIHHEVAEGGIVGAANVAGCRAGIAVLNGGRTGTTIPDGDRRGVYNHLAGHLRDAGVEPPALALAPDTPKYVDEAIALRDSAEALVERLTSLAEVDRGHLTVAKREATAACPAELRAAADALDQVLAETSSDRSEQEDGALGLDAEFELQRLQQRL